MNRVLITILVSLFFGNSTGQIDSSKFDSHFTKDKFEKYYPSFPYNDSLYKGFISAAFHVKVKSDIERINLLSKLNFLTGKYYKFFNFSEQKILDTVYFPVELIVHQKKILAFSNGIKGYITSINGVPINTILLKAKKEYLIKGYYLSNVVRDFSFYYRLLVGERKSYSIEYLDFYTRKKRTAFLEAVPYHRKKRNLFYDEEKFDYKYYLKQNTAFLELKNTTPVLSSNQLKAYSKHLKKIFSGLRKENTTNLVIDFRGSFYVNNDLLLETYPYLIRKTERYASVVIGKNGLTSNEIGEKSRDKIDSRHVAFKDKATRQISSSFVRFNSNIIFLVNQQTNSDILSFIANVYDKNKRCIIVGEKVPESPEYIYTKETLEFIMPESLSTISIPKGKIVNDVSNYRVTRNFEPNYIVVDDVSTNSDEVLEFLKDFVNNINVID